MFLWETVETVPLFSLYKENNRYSETVEQLFKTVKQQVQQNSGTASRSRNSEMVETVQTQGNARLAAHKARQSAAPVRSRT